MPFFCDPSSLIKYWCISMINDYHVSKNFNIPIGNNLNTVDAWMIDCFTVIEQELNNIKKYEVGKNGT